MGLSGCIIKPHQTDQAQQRSTEEASDSEDEDGEFSHGLQGSEVTHLTLLGQINLQGSLQVMLKGAYKSGLLVYGIRSFFQNLTEHIDSYVKIVDI